MKNSKEKGIPTKILFANLIVFAEFPHSKWENTNTISVAIGRATIKPASSGRLFDNHELKEITTAAIKTFMIAMPTYRPLSRNAYLPVKLAAIYLPLILRNIKSVLLAGSEALLFLKVTTHSGS